MSLVNVMTTSQLQYLTPLCCSAGTCLLLNATALAVIHRYTSCHPLAQLHRPRPSVVCIVLLLPRFEYNSRYSQCLVSLTMNYQTERVKLKRSYMENVKKKHAYTLKNVKHVRHLEQHSNTE